MDLEEVFFRLAELERRVANIVQPAVVIEADYSRALAKVRIGDIESTFLPWLTMRAGGNILWDAPDLGEQVIVFSPNGEPTQGFILPALYQASAVAPADTPNVTRKRYKDGAIMDYDRSTSTARIALPEGGKLAVSIGGTSILEFTAEGWKVTTPNVDWTVGGGS